MAASGVGIYLFFSVSGFGVQCFVVVLDLGQGLTGDIMMTDSDKDDFDIDAEMVRLFQPEMPVPASGTDMEDRIRRDLAVLVPFFQTVPGGGMESRISRLDPLFALTFPELRPLAKPEKEAVESLLEAEMDYYCGGSYPDMR